MTIDDQIAALAPLNAHTVALLAGYARSRQFTDYRAKGSIMPSSRLEKLAAQLEYLAAQARGMK